MMSRTDDEELPRFFGKYELLERIGSGGMAEVFLARLPGIGGFSKTVVIKRLRPEMKSNAGYVHMFVEEAKLAAEVQHRNVVQIFELGSLDNGEVYMAMEYVPGTDLKHLLRLCAKTGRRLPVWFGAYVVHELLEALSFAHNLTDAYDRPRNIVHCDVTPENVFVSRLGDVKLADFGVAVDDSRSTEPFAGQLKGKIPYMSPEQLSGQRPDRRSDIFAAGVVLWECLTQRRLFSGETQRETMARVCSARRTPPSELSPDVPPDLDAVVLQALAIDCNDRIQSTGEMQGRLRTILSQIAPRIGAAEVRSVLQDFLHAKDSNSQNTDSAVVHELSDSDVVGVRTASVTTAPIDTAPIPQTPVVTAPLSSADPVIDVELSDASNSEEPTVSASRLPSGGYSIVQPQHARDAVGPLPRNLLSMGATPQAPIAAQPGTMETHDVLRRHPRRQPLPPKIDPQSLASNIPISAPPPPRLGSDVGRHPMWVRTTTKLDSDPQSPQEAIETMRELIEINEPSQVQLSSNGQHWVTAASFLDLLGALLPAPMPPGANTVASKSLVRWAGELAGTSQSGTLWVQTDHGSLYRLLIKNGRLLTVDSGADPLGPLARGLANPGAAGTELAAAVHTAVSDNTKLTASLTKRSAKVLRPWVVRRMQENLQHVFSVDEGRAVFVPGDVEAPPAADPVPLMRLLAPVVSRARRSRELREALAGRLDQPMSRAMDFDERLKALGLGEAHMSRCRPFGHGYTLSESLGYAKTGADTKLALTLAYLLLELDLLRADPISEVV